MTQSDSRPLVSVAMPTYPSDDRMPYLREAIESALAQTYTNLEIVVSDNSASARVADLAASFRDERVRYRENGHNIGPMKNALAAYKAGRGPLVTTLFDDDMWEPTFLEKLVEPLEADPEVTMAFCDHHVIRHDGVIDAAATEANTRLWKRDRLAAGTHRPFLDLAVVDRCIPVGMGTVFRRSAIDWDDFPEQVNPIYDLWLGYLAARDGGGAWYTPERLTRYRVHPTAMTTGARYDRPAVFCYERFLGDDRLRSVHREGSAESAGFHAGLGITLLEEGNRREARHHLVESLRRRPRPRAAGALALSFVPGSPRAVVDKARSLQGSVLRTATRR